jgi:GTP cyclohydrolase II
MTEEEYCKYCHESRNSYQIVKDPANKNRTAYYTKLSLEEISEHPEHLSKPNWFQINVHYDMATNQNYLVLKYGSHENNKIPIVRIQSENIFNRFPLVDRAYAQRYERSLDYIIRNGYGLVLIFYSDGRGAGLANYVLNLEN